MKIHSKLLAPLAAALLLAACGGHDISGTYGKTDSALTIRFDSGKAYVKGLTSMDTIEASYEVDGDRIKVDGPHGPHLVLTRKADGTLHLDALGGTLVKTEPEK